LVLQDSFMRSSSVANVIKILGPVLKNFVCL
jgi:hypothetical protein